MQNSDPRNARAQSEVMEFAFGGGEHVLSIPYQVVENRGTEQQAAVESSMQGGSGRFGLSKFPPAAAAAPQ